MSPGEAFTGLGYATGAGVFLWRARSVSLPWRAAAILVCVALVFGLVGAKVFQALAQGSPSEALNPGAGGRALFAGISVGWIAVEIAKKSFGLQASTGDAFAFALPAGEAVGRIGCLLNGCCFGTPTEVPWAVWQHGALRHPAQIYSSLASVGVFLAILALSRLTSTKGLLFPAFLAMWGLTRFGIEFFRDGKPLLWGLTMIQLVCIETIVFGALTIVIQTRRRQTIDTA